MMEFLTQPRGGWQLAAFLVATTILFVVIMAAIHPTSTAFKKRLTSVLAFLGGLFYLLEFILPGNITVGQPKRVVDSVVYSASVRSVREGSPAAVAGLQRGDIFASWNGVATPDFPSLQGAISETKPGTTVPVTVYRVHQQAPVSAAMTLPPAATDPDGDGPLTAPPITPRALGLKVRNTANPLSPYVTPLGNVQRIFLALALMLGIVNLFRINGRMVLRRRRGWWYALAFFAGFFAMFTVWALNYYQPGVPLEAMPVVEAGVPPTHLPATDAVLTAPPGSALNPLTIQYDGLYKLVYDGLFNALSATMFSLLAFFIVSAAYRAFRVRSLEASLLLASAIIMMLGLTPLGTQYITGAIPTGSPLAILRLERVAEWILLVLNGAAQRALLFGIAVGLMATSLRIWLSLERGQFFDAEM